MYNDESQVDKAFCAWTEIHTHAVAPTGLQNAACSTFSILWECAVIQQFRVGAECQDLETKRSSSEECERDVMQFSAQITAWGRKEMIDTNLAEVYDISFINTDRLEGRC